MYGNEKIKMRAIHLEFIIKKKKKEDEKRSFFFLEGPVGFTSRAEIVFS